MSLRDRFRPSDRDIIRIPTTSRVSDRRLVLVVILIPIAMSLIQVSSVNVALSSIRHGLEASESEAQWVLAGYALSFGITLVPAGRLGDLLGRGSLFVLGVAVFAAASIACGLAPDALFLNLARFAQGLGAGLLNPAAMGMIQQYFSGAGRARAFALMGMVIAVSVAIGPLMAGIVITAIGDEWGWRWSFLLNGPLGLLALALALAWLPFEAERGRRAARLSGAAEVPGSDAPDGGSSDTGAPGTSAPDTSAPERRRIDIDPIGATLLALAVVAIMYPFMDHQLPAWKYLLVVAGLALIGVWWIWERRYKARGREPMVDPDLLRIPSFANSMAVSGTFFVASTSLFVIVALFLQDGLGQRALVAGVIGLPNAAMSMYASAWAGRRVMRNGHWAVLVAVIATAVGTLLSALVVWLNATHGLSFWWLLLTLAICGFGQGGLMAANQTIAMMEVPVSHGSTAGGVKSTAERIATAVGTATMTSVFFGIHAQGGGWAKAFITTYVTIALVLGVALVIAAADWRRVRKSGDEGAARPTLPLD